MPGIERIGIVGFRRLRNINLEMRPLMVMIGANGVGKTSFMDAISMLSASAQGTLNSGLNGIGGVWDVITRDGSGVVSFSVDMRFPDYEPLEYILEIAPQGQGYIISHEELSQALNGYVVPFKYLESTYGEIHYYDLNIPGFVRPTWDHNYLESVFSQIPIMYQQPDVLRRTLRFMNRYHVIDVGQWSPVKLPQQLRPAVLPGYNGEDLAPFLYNLRETDRGRFEAVEDSLRASFSGFEHLGFPVIATGMVSMTWEDRNFQNPFYMHQLSEGTLRFLWLVALLHSPYLPAITMIDEPEVSLHPELLAILADLLREAADRTQLIVATHSDRLIRFLQPNEVVVMDICENGGATMTWGDSLELEGWLKDYSLDEVWQMGEMGGRA